MGVYQLTLQGGSYNPAARMDSSSQSDGSSRGRKSRTDSPGPGFGFLQGKRVASQKNLEGLMPEASPPRHSTACCDGLSERREVERRLSSRKMKMSGARDSETCNGSDSFRSEDSESLALWEEKDQPASTDHHGWMRLTTQSPRWLEAMRRFGRSSPVHPKSSGRDSLDRKPSQRSLHDSKSWYSKKSRNGESRSVRSPADRALRQSGELPSGAGSFSRLTAEDTRFTASAVAWDIPLRPEPLVEKPRLVTGLGWEIATNEKPIDAHSATELQCEAFSDRQSEYASCGTSPEDESPEIDPRHCKDQSPTEFVNVIDFVAPLLTKPHSMEKKDVASQSCERRVPFKWEAPQGKQLKAEEVAPATETPQPPAFVTPQYESLREQYIIKSKSAPLDGLYVIVPKASQARPPRAPTSTIKEDYVTPDSFLTKSRSSSDADGPLRRVYNSPDHRLFTKLRKSVFGAKSEVEESSSPRSILRGPDDGSVPSSNPSLRSDPGTPRPTSSASQSMSSCSASFDSGDYEMAYDLNSTAACIIVESRRVSLSFRDFGPARPDVTVKGDDIASETVAASNIELLGCDDRLRSLPETMQSPELWTATFSARYQVCDSPEREPEFTSQAAPVNAVPCKDHKQEEVQVPIVIQKSRSRNGEFTARLGVMFSPLRLISSHESNHSCFVAATLSPPHEVDDQSPTYSATLEFLSASELHSSSTKGSRKAKSSWTHGEKVKSKSSTSRRHSSDDSQTVMVSISKAMKKILSKCHVKLPSSKGKSKMGSPVCNTLPPAGFHFTEVN